MSAYLAESDTSTSSSGSGRNLRKWCKSFVQWLQEQQHGESLLVTVPDAFLDDDFNLVDIERQLDFETASAGCCNEGDSRATKQDSEPPSLDTLLEIIQGRAPEPWKLRDAAAGQLVRQAVQLYVVAHGRYLQTRAGQQAMEAVIEGAGRVPCRRVLCQGAPMLPMGESSRAGVGPVRFWCPCCRECYAVGTPSTVTLDGAAFGPSFPLLYLLSFKGRSARDLAAMQGVGSARRYYEPKVFGFRLRAGIPSFKGHHVLCPNSHLQQHQ